MPYLTKPFALSFKSKEFALQIGIPRTDIWLNDSNKLKKSPARLTQIFDRDWLGFETPNSQTHLEWVQHLKKKVRPPLGSWDVLGHFAQFEFSVNLKRIENK